MPTTQQRDTPIPHGAVGSAARLAILHHLAHRPQGATCATLADLIKLDDATTARVLSRLRGDDRIACERHGPHSRWYVPASRNGFATPAPGSAAASARCHFNSKGT